jgi:SAM-dependent methyltransferase
MSSLRELFFITLSLGIILGGTFLIGRSFGGLFAGAPYVPVRKRDIKDAMSLAKIVPGEWMADLGCGDGRILLGALEQGANVVGYEISPVLAWISRYRVRHFKDRATILRKNFFHEDLSKFDVLCVFQLIRLMPRLEAQLNRQAKPGARVISFAFDMPGWKLVEQKGIAKLFLKG